ncbi:MAG: Uma2 family endonuclease [Calothrix sp. CSU_2_0]|nr:Uma2 family endonuclease [Calothrix sp. CSU_2_0]
MTQTEVKIFTFDEFIEWYPENSEKHYELHDGIIVEMPKPKGEHSDLAGFLIEELLITIREMGKRGVWTIPKESIVKPKSEKSGYEPDIIVLNQEKVVYETHWKKESVIENAASVKLIVEVVSTNWQDDYYNKLRDYEEMGIEEYWIVDYAALGGKKFIGNPRQPTISVCYLLDGEYQISKFTDNSSIVSPAFPQLNLTAKQIFDSAL